MSDLLWIILLFVAVEALIWYALGAGPALMGLFFPVLWLVTVPMSLYRFWQRRHTGVMGSEWVRRAQPDAGFDSWGSE